MLIGLISDIHANLAALDAVLEKLAHVDRILCAGDIVGYYDQPNEVCDRLRTAGIETIRGNHDAYVVGALQPAPQHATAYRTDWTRNQLTADNLAWLQSLPLQLDLTFGDTEVTLRHANPWDEEGYLYADSPLIEKVHLAAAQILIVGHTHYPLSRRAGNGMLVNPGSVGQPRDRNPRASFACLDLPERSVSFHRVEYDVSSLQQRLESLGWDAKAISILSRTA